jgi:hypothetical protein
MIATFNRLFDKSKPAFAQERTFERARTLAMSSLVGLGRLSSSLTGLRPTGFSRGRDLIQMRCLHRYAGK